MGVVVASILDRRLFAQVEMMRVACGLAVVLGEGDVFSTRCGIETAALEGALPRIAVPSGAKLKFSAHPAQSAAWTLTMARNHQQGFGHIPPPRAARPQ